jgi:hypothetical protein
MIAIDDTDTLSNDDILALLHELRERHPDALPADQLALAGRLLRRFDAGERMSAEQSRRFRAAVDRFEFEIRARELRATWLEDTRGRNWTLGRDCAIALGEQPEEHERDLAQHERGPTPTQAEARAIVERALAATPRELGHYDRTVPRCMISASRPY